MACIVHSRGIDFGAVKRCFYLPVALNNRVLVNIDACALLFCARSPTSSKGYFEFSAQSEPRWSLQTTDGPVCSSFVAAH